MVSEAFIATALADRIDDVILVTNADGIDPPDGPVISYCNGAFERLTGWSRADAIGRTPRILQTPDTDRAALDMVRTALHRWAIGDDDASARVDLLNQARDGRPYWVDFKLFPIWGPNGERIWASVQRDITERVKREDAAVAEALGDWNAPPPAEALAARIAHDLRAPLNSVIGYTDLLVHSAGGDLSLEHSFLLGEIADAAEHALRLSNDLLDASAIRAGHAQPRPETGAADELIAPIIAMLRPIASKRGVLLSVRGSGDAKLWCDPMQARRCLLNIIDNAIKASDADGVVTITIDARDDCATIAVSDEGCGMNEAEIARARTPYGRGADASVRGFGLGLPIAIDLMRLQGGDLTIRSQPGVGSTVVLSFNQNPPRRGGGH